MRAVVLDGPGPPEALVIRHIPVPEPAVGWVLIRVRAFGLNRSELHVRLGLAQGVTFPRVPGIEAVGVEPPSCRSAASTASTISSRPTPTWKPTGSAESSSR
jgi:hypothetical protein